MVFRVYSWFVLTAGVVWGIIWCHISNTGLTSASRLSHIPNPALVSITLNVLTWA